MKYGPPIAEITTEQFDRICRMLYEQAGISLKDGKQELVKARLTRRVRATGVSGLDEYIKYVEHDASGAELTAMIDVLTTNKTSFFRESAHFDYLGDRILPDLVSRNRRIRIWSAGCSTGEEPYSIAMMLREKVRDADSRDVRILATDISTQVLAVAKAGIYEEAKIRDVPPKMVSKYFAPAWDGHPGHGQASAALKGMITFARLNLMDAWPMQGPFDAIFCRNVMIYFDKPTQQELVHRFWQMLPTGGHLFVGHSESLASTSTGLSYVMPALYVKT